MTARDELARGYEPRWDLPDRIGRQGELFACSAVDAIRDHASAEIKTDAACVRTGRVFLEAEALISGQWVPSGINREAVLWAHVVPHAQVVIFAPRERVREIAVGRGTLVSQDGRNPTRGYVLSLAQFVLALAHAA